MLACIRTSTCSIPLTILQHITPHKRFKMVVDVKEDEFLCFQVLS